MAQFGGTPMVIMTQPAAASKREWNSGLLSCCDDVGICCCGLFCLPCLGCQVAGSMGECCLCGTSMAMRTLVRTTYNISGSLCKDFCATAFCLPCSVCQIKREINYAR